MTRRGAALVLLLFGLTAAGGEAAEVKTLKGKTITGDLTSLSDKEVVLTKDGKAVATPLEEVLTLDLGPAAKLPADATVSQVQLVDGTTLYGKDLLLKKDKVSLTLLSTNAEATLPVSAVDNILNNAQDEKLRKAWGEAVGQKRERDTFAVYRDGVLNPLKGTLGEGSPDGTKIEFTLASGAGGKRELEIAKSAWLIFFRIPNPLATPPKVRLTDKGGNLFRAATLAFAEDGTVTASLPSGVEFKVARADLARLDYSTGRQTYLSDTTPDRRVLESASGERFAHLILNKNLNNTGPMRLKGEAFNKGLAMFTYTELEYQLKGDYNEFRAVAGIDDEVGGADGSVHLLIEGDGRELLSVTFNRQDKVRAQPITLNIKDVDKLRIVVSDPDGKDIGKHLNLANAQVTK